MSFQFSTRSYKNLVGVDPRLVCICGIAITTSTIDFVVTEGLRTEERQKELFAQRKTTTLNSKHLIGHAVDVAAWVHGEIDWKTWKYYERIAIAFKNAGKYLNVPVVWGGDWHSFKDGCHFELVT